MARAAKSQGGEPCEHVTAPALVDESVADVAPQRRDDLEIDQHRGCEIDAGQPLPRSIRLAGVVDARDKENRRVDDDHRESRSARMSSVA